MPPSSSQRQGFQRARGLERHAEATGRVEKSTEGFDELDALLAERDSVLGIETMVEEDRHTQDLNAQSRELASQLGTEEEVKAMASEAFSALRGFMSVRRKVLDLKTGLSKGIDQLIRQAHSSREKESATLWKKISRYEGELAKTDALLEHAAESNPISFQAHWLMKLKEQKRQFEQTGVIETDSIRKQSEEMMNDVRRKLEGTNGVAALLGPTGSGKSVMAKKIAATFGKDGQYEFVSAHPKMTVDDLIERMGIVVKNTPAEEVPGLVKEAQAKFAQENPELKGDDLSSSQAMIEDVLTSRESQKVLTTEKVLEAVGRAAEEGNIVVIDEFNYLPPDTLAAINDLLSGGTGTKEGFGVIFTGNVGKEYLKRQSLDPAFVNRVLSGVVEYGFPPQELDRSFADTVKSREELADGEAVPDRDLFQIALTQLVDNKGNLLAPENALEKTWDFTRIVSLTQKLSSGSDFRDLGLDGAATQGVTAFKFESVFLSFRNLNQVLREWKLDGFTKPLDNYVLENIIRPAAVVSKKEAAQLYYLFSNWGGMFEGDQWDEIKIDSTTWNIAGLENVSVMEGSDVELHPFLPSEVVEALSGKELPSYDTLDGVQSEAAAEAAEVLDMERLLAEAEAFELKSREAFEKEPDIIALCAELAGATAPA